MSSTVGLFLQGLQNEDKGVTGAAIFMVDGSEIATSTLMGILLMNNFKLVVINISFTLPKRGRQRSKHVTEMENMKYLVHRLFTALYSGEFLKKTQHLLEKTDHLKGQLQPLEQMKARNEAGCETQTSGPLPAGLMLLFI